MPQGCASGTTRTTWWVGHRVLQLASEFVDSIADLQHRFLASKKNSAPLRLERSGREKKAMPHPPLFLSDDDVVGGGGFQGSVEDALAAFGVEEGWTVFRRRCLDGLEFFDGFFHVALVVKQARHFEL